MKIFVTTSDSYHHILPVFFYLYGKYWGDPMTLVGYKKPEMELPDYCTWKSLGKQGRKEDFCSDMRKAFENETEPFVWMMEDTFLKRKISDGLYQTCINFSKFGNVGRISLTNDSYVFYTDQIGSGLINVFATPKDSDYRLSLQPAIWNPGYLNKHLKENMNPWQFENQHGTLMTFSEDCYMNIKLEDTPLKSNEGIRRHDLYKFDFTGMSEEDLKHLKQMGYTHNPWTR